MGAVVFMVLNKNLHIEELDSKFSMGFYGKFHLIRKTANKKLFKINVR